VRIPLAIAKQAGLGEGDGVTLALTQHGDIVLRPARRKYELSDLIARITPKNRHRETDWGPAQGEESW
jgi:antitoxin MazE